MCVCVYACACTLYCMVLSVHAFQVTLKCHRFSFPDTLFISRDELPGPAAKQLSEFGTLPNLNINFKFADVELKIMKI